MYIKSIKMVAAANERKTEKKVMRELKTTSETSTYSTSCTLNKNELKMNTVMRTSERRSMTNAADDHTQN